MIAHFGITQGTPEWFFIRYRKVGGSASNGLFVNSDTLLDCVLSEMMEEFEAPSDSYTNTDISRGHEMEPLGRYNLSLYTGIDFKECGWLQSEECDLLGVSPDGISIDFKKSCEIKCPTAKKHTNTVRLGVIPSEHISQCLHYFTVNPHLEEHYFCSFRPESIKPLFVKKLTRDTILDMGFTEKTKVKEDRGLGIKEYVAVVSVLKTVDEWCKMALENGINLEKQLISELTKINGI